MEIALTTAMVLQTVMRDMHGIELIGYIVQDRIRPHPHRMVGVSILK
jgi:hypothetical protein